MGFPRIFDSMLLWRRRRRRRRSWSVAMAAKLGSFRYTFAEKRERLLSTKGYSELGFPNIYEEEYAPRNCCSYRFCCDKIVEFCRSVQDVTKKAYEMGRSDPRKIVFAIKIGLSLMLISLLVFLKEPIKELSRYSVWAILTVVVVFEFSIGNFLFEILFRFLIFISGSWLSIRVWVIGIFLFSGFFPLWFLINCSCSCYPISKLWGVYNDEACWLLVIVFNTVEIHFMPPMGDNCKSEMAC